jgi:hypothetical protein
MEIGFAAARGVPIVILTTDFQSYGPREDGPAFAFSDPLPEMLASGVERAHRLAPPSQPSGQNRLNVFRYRNLQPLDAAIDRAAGALLGVRRRGMSSQLARNLAFVEPSPYFADDMWGKVTGQLEARGWTVHLATRLRPDADTYAAARIDWDAFCQSALAVVDVRGPEVAPGAALMIGACAATGRSVLAGYSAGWQTFADGREPNWRNLMVQYAVHGRFTDEHEFIALADAL